MSMSDNPAPLIQNKGPIFRFDGTIPGWGIALLMLAGGSYVWTSIQDLSNRMVIQESRSIEQGKKQEKYEENQQHFAKVVADMAKDVAVSKELLVRIEKRIEPK